MFEKVLEETSSPISGKIKVVSFFGNKRIVVDGLVQSGGLLEGVWRKALSIIEYQGLATDNCLILGLGGGTLATLISQKWPESKIIGIEIDKEIIRLGKKYFALHKIPHLNIINEDAIKFVQKQDKRYQLIFIDLYLGREIAKGTEKESFLKNLKEILTKEGVIIINRLFFGEEKRKAEKFIDKLGTIFPKLKLVRTHSNLLIFLRKR